MIVIACILAFYGLIFVWLVSRYMKEVRLEKLRKYDRKCRVSAMKENRERDYDL